MTYIGIVDSIKAQHAPAAKRLEEAERLIREVLESGRLVDSLWETAALEWVGDDRVYCGCLNPEWKVWTDGSTYCTHCGWHQRPSQSDASEKP